MVGSLLDELVRRATTALNETGTNYALVGGVAMVLAGRDRSTRDLDIVVQLEPEKLEAFLMYVISDVRQGGSGKCPPGLELQ